jgi:hypothetical protein
MTDNAAPAYGAELADSVAGLKRTFDLHVAAVKRDLPQLPAGPTIRPVRRNPLGVKLIAAMGKFQHDRASAQTA